MSTHLIVCAAAFRSDLQLPWTITFSVLIAAQRRSSADSGSPHLLLKLDAVTLSPPKSCCEFRPEDHPVSLKIRSNDSADHFLCGLIQIHELGRGFLLAEERA